MLKNIVLCFALSSTIALAVERPQLGGATSGGGDLGLIRKANAARLLDEGRMKNRLREYLMRLEILDLDIDDPEASASIRYIRPHLDKDIDESPYVFGGPCVDEDGNAKTASTLNNVPGAPVCFDAAELSKQDLSEATLVGLALHEHARHLGIADEEHVVASYAISDYEATQKIRASDERGLTLDSPSQVLVAQALCNARFYTQSDELSRPCPKFLEWNTKFQGTYRSVDRTQDEFMEARILMGALADLEPHLRWARGTYSPFQAMEEIQQALLSTNASFLSIVRKFDEIYQIPQGM